MAHYEFDAILDIHVSCDASSREEALASAVKNKTYEIAGARMNDAEPTKYLSCQEFAARVGKNAMHITKLCANGAIPGVIRIGGHYAIPENAQLVDHRITSGKYTGLYDKYGRKRYEEMKARKAAGLPDPPRRPPNTNPIFVAREKQGISRAELAAAMGVKPITVAGWETGYRNPKRSTLQRIADALGVDVNTLTE